MEGIAWSLLGVFLLVLANGFFVATEFALVTVRRTRIEQLVAEGVSAARAAQNAILHLDRYIAGTQVGITVASIALGWIGEPALARIIDPFLALLGPMLSESLSHSVSFVLSFTLITFLHVILGELVPKSLALQKPEATSLVVARPMAVVIILFQPFIWSLNGLGNALLRLLGLEASGEHLSVHSPREIESLIRQSHAAGHLDDFERRMLQKTFRFNETTVAEIMTPRSEIRAIDLTAPIEAIFEAATMSQHTRLPVYRSSIDEILGVIYLQDLFRLYWEKKEPLDLNPIVRNVLFVPEGFHLDAMIGRFREEHVQIAIAIDEYGGTAGLLTLEDIIETVFGEIQDQNEDPTPTIVRGDDGSLVVRGDTRLEELSEALGYEIFDEESDTIAGYIMHALGSVPHEGDEVPMPRGRCRVLSMDRHRVTKVIVIPR